MSQEDLELEKNEEDEYSKREIKTSDEDKDQNYIKLDEKQEKKDSKITEVFNNLVNDLTVAKQKISEFLSRRNQQRNLDRENGGIETEEQKELSGKENKDVWDDRSEEVDKMGSTDTFNTTGMKSVVWKAKKERIKAKKQAREAAKQGAEAGISSGIGANLLGGEKKMSMLEKLQLRKENLNQQNGADLWR
jgi:hypothetical protein